MLESFEEIIKKEFVFLEKSYEFIYSGLNCVDEDPRDSFVAAKYRRFERRIDIVWNSFAMSLGILIKQDHLEQLKRRESFIYFEPFIEYMSCGSVKPIIPQIYPKMSVGKIEKTILARKKCFKNGVEPVIPSLAKRLIENYDAVNLPTLEQVRKYHEWYINRD